MAFRLKLAATFGLLFVVWLTFMSFVHADEPTILQGVPVTYHKIVDERTSTESHIVLQSVPIVFTYYDGADIMHDPWYIGERGTYPSQTWVYVPDYYEPLKIDEIPTVSPQHVSNPKSNLLNGLTIEQIIAQNPHLTLVEGSIGYGTLVDGEFTPTNQITIYPAGKGHCDPDRLRQQACVIQVEARISGDMSNIVIPDTGEAYVYFTKKD